MGGTGPWRQAPARGERSKRLSFLPTQPPAPPRRREAGRGSSGGVPPARAEGEVLELGDAVGEADGELLVEELGRDEELPLDWVGAKVLRGGGWWGFMWV